MAQPDLYSAGTALGDCQNILGRAGDLHAEMTYRDAEATLHETQAGTGEQDEAINAILERLLLLEASVAHKAEPSTPPSPQE